MRAREFHTEGWQDTIQQAGQQARKAVDSAVNSIPRPFDEREVAKDLKKGTANQNKQVREMPARLRMDPEGATIIPHGGMGSGSEATWRTMSSNRLRQVADMIEAGNYQGAEHVLYKNGFLEGAVRALARLAEFQQKQGRRKIARGREIDLG